MTTHVLPRSRKGQPWVGYRLLGDNLLDSLTQPTDVCDQQRYMCNTQTRGLTEVRVANFCFQSGYFSWLCVNLGPKTGRLMGVFNSRTNKSINTKQPGLETCKQFYARKRSKL